MDNRLARTIAAADDLDNPVIQALVEEVERLRRVVQRLKDVAHDGKHKPGDYPYSCLGCRVAAILEGSA